jgi:hypothetical protein
MASYSIIDYVMLHEKANNGEISEKEFKNAYKSMRKDDETPYNEKEKIVIKELYKDIIKFSIF